jgi:uncharacterized protein
VVGEGLMYLIDTNVWLEVLLGQKKAPEADAFLKSMDPTQLAITDFSLYSIGIILFRLKQKQIFNFFVSDVISGSKVRVLRLDIGHLLKLASSTEAVKLDFDDAYQ